MRLTCQWEDVGIGGNRRVRYPSQRTLSPNGHLMVVMGVLGLLWLRPFRSIYTSTFSMPPLINLQHILNLTLLSLILSSFILAERVTHNHYSNDNSKAQYIRISTGQ
uniref:Putative movement protein n=1 Tax=Pelargonium flower break virus TaxID=35291 RepID=Q1WIR3_9TOMB|nr:putative movement protein [Pelargonium flower break virus]